MTAMTAPPVATVLPFPAQPAAAAADDMVAGLLAALTPQQKAAILVLQLGRDESARVLAQLGEDELEELSTEIARMGSVPPEVATAVVDEFTAVLAGGALAVPTYGGMAAARDMLAASVGRERAEAIADRVSQNFVELPFSFLQKLDPRQIVSFLADEHPQTVALVLAHLPAGLASHVLAGLTREVQADVAHRIAVMDRTSPELIRQVESSLERRLSSLGVRSDLSTVGGLRPLVDIINRADRAHRADDPRRPRRAGSGPRRAGARADVHVRGHRVARRPHHPAHRAPGAGHRPRHRSEGCLGGGARPGAAEHVRTRRAGPHRPDGRARAGPRPAMSRRRRPAWFA